jgi:hypothetical protein
MDEYDKSFSMVVSRIKNLTDSSSGIEFRWQEIRKDASDLPEHKQENLLLNILSLFSEQADALSEARSDRHRQGALVRNADRDSKIVKHAEKHLGAGLSSFQIAGKIRTTVNRELVKIGKSPMGQATISKVLEKDERFIAQKNSLSGILAKPKKRSKN